MEPWTDNDPLDVLDWLQVQQALRWVEVTLHLEPSTLSVRVAHKIQMYLESEINA